MSILDVALGGYDFLLVIGLFFYLFAGASCFFWKSGFYLLFAYPSPNPIESSKILFFD